MGSAAATALSTAVVSAAAALAAVLLAREFGRTAETDGFLAAYGVYLLVVLVAQALRPVLIPDLTRAAAEGRLASEALGYAAALLLLSAGLVAAAIVLADPLAEAVTGGLPSEAARSCASALPWLVPAACAHLFAALAASVLAALDNYGLAAIGYATAGVAGLVLFALFTGHGVIALAWGLALNGAISFAVPALVLGVRSWQSNIRRPRREACARGVRLQDLTPLSRPFAALARGAAIGLALQGLYVIALRLAADEGVGEVTSFSYAYLIGSVLVAATASSLGLISSAPLTRGTLGPEEAAAHVVHSSWLSVAVIVGGAGVFALAGGRLAEAILGDAFSGDAGEELGRLVVYLAPWMVASVALTVTFPLLFVLRRSGAVIPLALGLPALQIVLGLAFRELWGVAGIALSLALTTLAGLLVLLAAVSPRTLAAGALGLGRLSVLQAAAGAVTFGALSLFLNGFAAALAGLAAYTLLLLAVRPRGLREAWSYIRALQ